MKEIATISPERLNNGAHYQFMTSVLNYAVADEKIAEETHLKPLVQNLTTALAKEDEDLKISKKSLLTDDIAEADNLRDSLYRAYKKAVKTYLDFPIAAQAQAAKVLNQHIKDYGIDPAMQLNQETGLLTNFISDLSTKYTEQVTTLGLQSFVAELSSANNKVQTLTAQRTMERTGIVKGALKASRIATDTAYRELVKMTNALALVLGEADYANFIDYVNAEISHYKQEVINGRSTSTKEEEVEKE